MTYHKAQVNTMTSHNIKSKLGALLLYIINVLPRDLEVVLGFNGIVGGQSYIQ